VFESLLGSMILWVAPRTISFSASNGINQIAGSGTRTIGSQVGLELVAWPQPCLSTFAPHRYLGAERWARAAISVVHSTGIRDVPVRKIELGPSEAAARQCPVIVSRQIARYQREIDRT